MEAFPNGTIHVINPNSSPHVTAAIEFATAPFQAVGSKIVCAEMQDGPRGIVSESEIHDSVRPMLAYALKQQERAVAFVIACFADPGLHLLRERLNRPVFGIGECGALTALTLGQRLGVITLVETAIPRHLRWFGAMGIIGRLAGDRAMGLGVAELKNHETMFERMVEVGQALKRQDGADVVLLGGAAMSKQRAALEKELGIPVVDPNFAALAMADAVSKRR